MNKKKKNIALRVPKGYAHFLRSGAGSHGKESNKTQRRKYKQSLRFGKEDA